MPKKNLVSKVLSLLSFPKHPLTRLGKLLLEGDSLWSAVARYRFGSHLRTPKAVAALFYACFSHNFPSRALTYCSGFGSSRAETLCLTSYFFLSYSSEVSV